MLQKTTRRRWRRGLPPRDGNDYEVRQRTRNAGGQMVTVQLVDRAHWAGGFLCRKSQLTGLPIVVTLTNQWRCLELK